MKQYFTSSLGKIALASLFVLSGLTKTLSLQEFAIEIALYLDVYAGGLFAQWNMLLAVLLCVGECIIGLWGITRIAEKLNSVCMLTLMSFFTLLTGVNLFFPTELGSIESCGCFGELIHFTPTTSFLKSLILWILSCAVCLRICRQESI